MMSLLMPIMRRRPIDLAIRCIKSPAFAAGVAIAVDATLRIRREAAAEKGKGTCASKQTYNAPEKAGDSATVAAHNLAMESTILDQTCADQIYVGGFEAPVATSRGDAMSTVNAPSMERPPSAHVRDQVDAQYHENFRHADGPSDSANYGPVNGTLSESKPHLPSTVGQPHNIASVANTAENSSDIPAFAYAKDAGAPLLSFGAVRKRKTASSAHAPLDPFRIEEQRHQGQSVKQCYEAYLTECGNFKPYAKARFYQLVAILEAETSGPALKPSKV